VTNARHGYLAGIASIALPDSARAQSLSGQVGSRETRGQTG